MIIFIIAIIIGILLIFSGIYFSKFSKKQLLQLIEESKQYIPKIDSFINELNSLSNNYISKSKERDFSKKWQSFYLEIYKKPFSKKIPDYEKINNFIFYYYNLEEIIKQRNSKFIEREIQENINLLSNIDGKSLDLQQRTVVVTDEDKTLVLAGAGSGKTLTIAAKVKYLCEVKKINPEDILLISFTNKSSLEMTERINKKLGINIEALTFHKLGLNIIKKDLGFRPDVFDDLNSFVLNFFENELLNYPDFIKKITEYFIYYLEIPEDIDNYENLGEYYESEKTCDLETLKSKYEKEKFIKEKKIDSYKNLITLNKEKVKSIEETKIANFLFMNGIKYEYEKIYPYKTEDLNKKNYRPDFYLSDYDIYLEHFGITKDYKCPWLSEVEEKKYIEGINWKRNFHKQNGTKLIETYSYYTKKGRLLEELEKLLIENGVEFKPLDFIEIFENVYSNKSNKYFSEFIKLCCSFITLFKSNNYNVANFAEMKDESARINNSFIHKRNCIFMEIIEFILQEYQKYLKDNKLIDFSDMINEAAEKIENGSSIHNYKYIIIDEYQDISQSRFNLIKAVLNVTNAKLLCVGDDWQSIYRFAGSDISLFTNFEKYLGFTKILKIEKTYRNSQQLIDEAAVFITKNELQLHKKLISDKKLNYPLVFWGYDNNPNVALKQIMQKIIHDFGPDKSILLLGRINYDIDILESSGLFSIQKQKNNILIKYLHSPDTPVSFLTVHKSKGLEADNVILLNFMNDKLGFPNQIADDKVLNFVLNQSEDYLFAEERRLFYVAITRTKNRTFVLTDNSKPSIFFKEFNESEKCCFINIKKNDDKSKILCPRCKTGILYEIKSNDRIFVGCSNYPQCRYKLNNITILSSPKQCPRCGGFLIKRKAKNMHWFIGCTNYPYCEYTEEIKY